MAAAYLFIFTICSLFCCYFVSFFCLSTRVSGGCCSSIYFFSVIYLLVFLFFYLVCFLFLQEWAAAVALGAWEDVQTLLSRYPPPPPPLPRPWSRSRLEMAATLDAVARRARQVERILEASMVSCKRSNGHLVVLVLVVGDGGEGGGGGGGGWYRWWWYFWWCEWV